MSMSLFSPLSMFQVFSKVLTSMGVPSLYAGLLVDLDGDGLLAVLDLTLDVFAEVLVRRGGAVEVEVPAAPRAGLVDRAVQGGVVRAVAVVGEAVEVRADVAQRQGDRATRLQVLGILGVDADQLGQVASAIPGLWLRLGPLAAPPPPQAVSASAATTAVTPPILVRFFMCSPSFIWCEFCCSETGNVRWFRGQQACPRPVRRPDRSRRIAGLWGPQRRPGLLLPPASRAVRRPPPAQRWPAPVPASGISPAWPVAVPRTPGSGWRSCSPAGASSGEGRSPCRMIRSRVRSTPGSGTGIAESRARVYGWRGLSNTLSTSPISTILPRYITATRLEMCRTTDRSWATIR